MASAGGFSNDPGLLVSTCQSECLYDHIYTVIKITLKIAFVIIIAFLARSWWRLRHVPGPFTAAVGTFQFCRSKNDHNRQLELEKLYYEYGDVVRTGPSRIVTTDVQALQRLTPIISAHESGFLRRVSQNISISYFSPHESLDDEEHVRKSLGAHMAVDIAKVAACMEDHCRVLVDTIKEACLSSGTRCHFLDPTSMAQEITQHVADLGDLDFYEAIYNKYAAGLNTRRAPANQLLATINYMATTMQNTLTRIIASPVTYARLREEIDGSQDYSTVLSPVQDDKGCKSYLQAVIREGIRLFPARINPLYTVPEDGATIGGHRIPSGITVALNNTALMHSKRIWGADADLFRPERWLEATATTFATMHQALIAPWGVGENATLHQIVYQAALGGSVREVCEIEFRNILSKFEN
ncbi:hypothetical protein PFICI_05484 [Pestalotiopsis fici W106-1]|uniref:Uncharacterized protein n=1 Tax=Pestalotiopsis fici (strain W106-1 / CGMCC3.15140) TaxID=1229662 RepID=W3XBZ6_PESFW|nr:uncharacterized protein PFICI_05484 [Pestalotiopsis fici W106-1]ETS83608.1 hypothetical protein PFICI_05484 [Pestalotiopsis fici W106-1]